MTTSSGDERDVRDVRGDARQELREFLATRRSRVTPQQAGLPTYGGERRRVPGLRREEVALLAGVSTDYYTRLERGSATGVSDSVIESVARALQLDDAERAHGQGHGRPGPRDAPAPVQPRLPGARVRDRPRCPPQRRRAPSSKPSAASQRRPARRRARSC